LLGSIESCFQLIGINSIHLSLNEFTAFVCMVILGVTNTIGFSKHFVNHHIIRVFQVPVSETINQPNVEPIELIIASIALN